MVRTGQTPLLVVEDSDEDFEILQILMEDMAVSNPVYRCKTGDRALDFLYGEDANHRVDSACRPSVILLDLNLPGIDGREVLERLKQDQQFCEIPIVVFTTSSDPKDIQLCYRKGANGYLIKPVNTDQLEKTVQAFVEYWLEANTSPIWDEMNLTG
ncbi:MAG: response regulator [Cyanobacteria bacterium P01_A01_bin.114]